MSDADEAKPSFQQATPADTSQLIRQRLIAGGDAPALAFGGRWRSWHWLQQSHTALSGLLRQYGLDAHATMGLVTRNRPQHVAAFIAQLAARRTTSMIYSMQSAAAIAADVERRRPGIVAADASDWSPELEAATTRIGALGLILTDEATPVVSLQPHVRPPEPAPQAQSSEDIAVELLSSGTTGAPKRIPLSWNAVDLMVADAQRTYAGSERREAPILLVQPMGNIAGLVYIAPPAANGQSIVLLEKFSVEAWSVAVRTYRPNRSSIPAAALRMILERGIPRSDLESLSVLAVGGSKLDSQTRARFEETYGIPVLTAYGATEFGGVIAHWSLPLYREWGSRKADSVGRPGADVQLRIVDPDSMSALPANSIGLLEACVPRIGPGWIRTTDLARVDSDGFLYLEGRADSAINRGGFKVVPEEVERVLKSHPAVADAAVIGIADPRLGEVPVAAVELRPHSAVVAADTLKEFAREKLLAYQVPVEIRVVDTLPRNPSMKISIPDVRALFSRK